MILVDTSVWIDHLATGDEQLQTLLEDGQVLIHPYVIGEVALGSLRMRDKTLQAMAALPKITYATPEEAMVYLNAERLFGAGIGYVDLHLLASTKLQHDTLLWTRDKRLAQVAVRLKIAVFVSH